jgi:hypothetical protein
MKHKRILLGILLSPVVILVFMGMCFIWLWISLIEGISFVITGKVDVDDGGW